jgi:hypothetical protein
MMFFLGLREQATTERTADPYVMTTRKATTRQQQQREGWWVPQWDWFLYGKVPFWT